MPHPRTGNRNLIRRINQNLLLNLIRTQGPISRAELAKRTQLAPATVSQITHALLSRGLVHEIGAGSSSGGRRPVLLKLEPQAGFVVGLKLAADSMAAAVTDLQATVLHYLEVPRTSDEPPTRTLGALIRTVERALKESRVDARKVLGIGIGMGGVIDSQNGICHYSTILNWRDVQVTQPLNEHFHLPVYVHNDVNTLTVAEQWFGHGKGVDHFVVVTIGRGIGMGIVANGQFDRGAFGGAGELGHVTLVKDGPPCDCGKRGCLEALASDPRVVEQARASLRAGKKTQLAEHGLTFDRIVAAARAGDGLAQRLLADSGRWLGIGIANVVNLLNPELVIVGGEGVRAGDWRFETMRAAIREHTFNGLGQSLQVVIEFGGDQTWARGAASLVLNEIFEHPIRQRDDRPIAVQG